MQKNNQTQLRAVIYARYSSHQQSEQSIEGQLRDCYAFAERNNIRIIGEYIDRAISAKTDHRPDFQRMIKDSDKHFFDIVLVWKLDRFARNRYDSANYKARLKKNNVKVMSAMENITGTPEGILMESLLEGMAEYFSAELAEKVSRGMRETALKCQVYGPIPYGYKSENKKYVVDEARAGVVRMIYQMYADGCRIQTIIDTLKAKGIVNSLGKDFGHSNVYSILSNPRYKGIYKYKDIEIPDGMPRIVDDELFEKVQKTLNINRRAGARHKAKVDYILTTKLFCGKCRAMMCGDRGTGRGGKMYYYYNCSHHKSKNKRCDKKPIRKELLEDMIITNILDNVLQDEIITRIADNAVKIQKEQSNNSILKALSLQLKKTNSAIENILNAIEQGVITKSTTDRLKELEYKAAMLEVEIDKERVSDVPLSHDEIAYLLESLRSGDPKDVKYRKRLIDIFIYRIYVYDDKLLLIYNYSNKENTHNESALLDYVSDSNLSGAPYIFKEPRIMRGFFDAIFNYSSHNASFQIYIMENVRKIDFEIL